MGKKIRLIARLDVKDTNLVKGIQLEGLRKLGDPNRFAKEYYEQGIDELLYIDIVASSASPPTTPARFFSELRRFITGKAIVRAV